jgi:hypothetical protein
VQAVLLHQAVVERDLVEQERHVRESLPARELAVEVMELPGVDGAVIRRNPHADEQNPRAGLLRKTHDGLEVGADVGDRQSAQAVVGAEFDDHDRRAVGGERAWQPRERAAGGLAARAGVDHAMPVAFGMQPRLQQGHPALLDADPVGCAQAVAEHDDRRRRGRFRRARDAAARDDPAEEQHDDDDGRSNDGERRDGAGGAWHRQAG